MTTNPREPTTKDAALDSERKPAPELRSVRLASTRPARPPAGREVEPDLSPRARQPALSDSDPASERHFDGGGGDALRGSGNVDPRLLAAWRQWLSALATDAEAALAAAHVYGELPPDARDAWLDALAEDAERIAVPAIAVYAPLLAVESDPARCKRIERAIGEIPFSASSVSSTVALRGLSDDGSRVVVLVAPLYLRFVRVLRCRYIPDEGFDWAKHDLLLRAEDAPGDGDELDGVHLETTPMKLVIEELAHAILAQRRRGCELPACLYLFADLFNAQIEEEPLP
jgi:hypothetical protein